MNALPNLDAIQEIIDSAEAAGLILITGSSVPLSDEQKLAAEEHLARLEEAMRKDPN